MKFIIYSEVSFLPTEHLVSSMNKVQQCLYNENEMLEMGGQNLFFLAFSAQWKDK